MSKLKRIPRIQYWRSASDNKWYGRLIGGNGKILWRTSEGDGYERRGGVSNAIYVLIRYGLEASVTEIKDPNSQ